MEANSKRKRKLSGKDNDDWIKLNVGGFRFETTVKTLSREDSMLSTMVTSEIPTSKDEDGCIKIDRPGKHFNLILDYLRSGTFPTLGSIKDVKELRNEADYYLIDELKKKCEHFIEEFFSEKRTILVKELFFDYKENQYKYTRFGVGIPPMMDGSISLSQLRIVFPSATGLCRHDHYANIQFAVLPMDGESIQLPEDYQKGDDFYYVLPIKARNKD